MTEVDLRKREEEESRPAILMMALIAGAAIACGDGNGDLPPGPASPSQRYALLPIKSIVEVGDYIGTTGFDGATFDLTDPAGCEAIQEIERAAATDEEREQIVADTGGRLCINRSASLIDGNHAVVTVQEYASGDGWLLTLEQTGDVWAVTGVEVLGS